jgi:carboxymethylenebutenolidase
MTQIERVSFSSAIDGERIGGEIVGPNALAPALILVPDVHGVSPLYRTMAERLAAEGFRTLVLDIYAREGAPGLTDFEQVTAWIAKLPDERVLADIGAAHGYVEARDDVRTGAVGVLGFCLGGQYALMAACRTPAFQACASFYGMLRSPGKRAALDVAPALACPLLGLYGADDFLIPAADVAALHEILERGGQEFDLVTFEGAGHAFLNEARPESYRPDAARDAWTRAVAWFRRHLRC